MFTWTVPEHGEHRVVIRAMANTLGGNLQRVLREDLGGTYGERRPEFTKRPTEEYRLTISFACDPGAHARISSRPCSRWSTISGRRGPARDRSRTQAALRRDLETDSRRNGYLLNQLAFAYQYDEPISDPSSLRTLYEQLTPSFLRDAAYLSEHDSLCEGAALSGSEVV